MAESFVKTLRRDYVYLSRIENAVAVLEQLPRWIEDYNEVHPHKGLRMRQPASAASASLTGAGAEAIRGRA